MTQGHRAANAKSTKGTKANLGGASSHYPAAWLAPHKPQKKIFVSFVSFASFVSASGLSSLNQYRMPARGARIARREERAYWAYVSDEQRREAGCPARQTVMIQRGQATSSSVPTRHTSAAQLGQWIQYRFDQPLSKISRHSGGLAPR